MNVVPISPQRLIGRVRTETPAGLILRRLLAYHPSPVERDVLMEGAGIIVRHRGPVCAYTSFHWHVERANDDLRSFGWQIDRVGQGEVYGVVPVSRAGTAQISSQPETV